MRQFTRRTVLAGATAAAATAVAPISGIRSAAADSPCPTESLKDFLKTADGQALNPAERDLLVGQAIELLDKFYVHLPIKRKLYGADPITRLENLRQELKQQPPANDRRFHAEMSAIFDSLRDLHTIYLLPEPYATAHAWLPFKVEACVEDGQRKYIVSRVVDGFKDDPNFVAGVEVVSWNRTPIEDAAELAGARGSNPSARRALGLARLTYRSLLRHPPHEEDSVEVRYRIDGRELDIRLPWSVSKQNFECGFKNPAPCTEIGQLQKFREFLYWPYVSCSSHFRIEKFPTPDGEFGYIRIFTFEALGLNNTPTASRDTQFVEQFQAHVAELAKDTRGLIIDVRDNGGGMSRASERCVQLVKQTTKAIEPARLYFRATDASLRLCQLGPMVSDVGSLGCNGMGDWIKSIGQAKDNNETFSGAFPYTCLGDANNTGRIYLGPVIVVTSALSYSAAELFAGAFQDHGGLILGVDETTGGGGAGVREHKVLHKYFIDGKQPSLLQDLQTDKGKGGFSVAFRRSKRVGLGAGKEVEDAGIQRDLAYAMTRNDLLNHNADLKMHAAELLAKMK